MHIIQFNVQSSKFKGNKFKVIIQFKVQNSKFKVNEGFSNYCERRYGQYYPAL